MRDSNVPFAFIVLCLLLFCSSLSASKPPGISDTAPSVTRLDLMPPVVEKERLIQTMRGAESARHRAGAAYAVVRVFGYDDEEVVQALIGALGDDAEEVRYRAAGSLGALEGRATAAVPALTALLSNEAARVMAEACDALAAIGASGEETLRSLHGLLESNEGTAPLHAGAALVKITGQTHPYLDRLIKALEEGDPPGVRFVALRLLGQLGPQAEASVPALLRLMGGHSLLGLFAINAVGKIGARPEQSVRALLDLLKGEDPQAPYGGTARWEAVVALGSFPTEKDKVLPILTDFVRAGPLQLAALLATRDLGADEPDVIAAVQHALAAEDPIVRAESFRLLAEFGAVSVALIQTAARAVRGDESPGAREAAVVYLRAQAAKDRYCAEAIQGLLCASGDESAAVRLAAVEALRAEHSCLRGRVVEALITRLGDRDYGVVREAVRALGALGSSAAAAVPTLRELAASYGGSGYETWDRKAKLQPLRALIKEALQRIGQPPAELTDQGRVP